MLIGLPGIGQQKAREVIAKLQGKLGAYALLDGAEGATAAGAAATEARTGRRGAGNLLQLQYTRGDAQQMIKRALTTNPRPTTTEEMLEVIYRQRG